LTPTINTKNSGGAQAPTPFGVCLGLLIYYLIAEVFFFRVALATRPERGGGGGTWWRCGDAGTSASPLGTEARGGQGQESRRPAARLLHLLAPSGSPACPFKARQSHFAPYTGRREQPRCLYAQGANLSRCADLNTGADTHCRTHKRRRESRPTLSPDGTSRNRGRLMRPSPRARPANDEQSEL
jgi:hypothetical protein